MDREKIYNMVKRKQKNGIKIKFMRGRKRKRREKSE